jgi:protein ImuB
MFACLYLPRPVNSISVRGEGHFRSSGPSVGQAAASLAAAQRTKAEEAADDPACAVLLQLARDFSPRVETHDARTVTLDISGLGGLIGDPRAVGQELRRSAADAGLSVHIAVAATSTAAIVLARGRAGLTVVPAGEEAAALAPLPLRLLSQLGFGLQPPAVGPDAGSLEPEVGRLTRWGLRTLGDLASLPSAELSLRMGPAGLRWQRWARGEEMRPMIPTGETEWFEQSLDLEWPIEELEPLSFVFARLFDPLCDRLERRDRGAVVLRVKLTLVTRDIHERSIQLPAPMRDARVLRTLALIDLESNPPPAAIDRVTVGVDVTEGRVLQFGLLARALPTDKLATLLARLGALMGSDCVGAPALVDSHRPGAFAIARFDPSKTPNPKSLFPEPDGAPASVLRRLRSPVPARVTLERGRPVRVTTDRRGFAGGRVERCAGPWRSSGEWWTHRWNCDEWDVVLSDGEVYRISRAHDRDAWFVEGIVD